MSAKIIGQLTGASAGLHKLEKQMLTSDTELRL